MTKFILNRWDFKVIERDLIAMGLEPLTEFNFAWTEEEPRGWMVEFFNDEDAFMWRLQHGHKWI